MTSFTSLSLQLLLPLLTSCLLLLFLPNVQTFTCLSGGIRGQEKWHDWIPRNLAPKPFYLGPVVFQGVRHNLYVSLSQQEWGWLSSGPGTWPPGSPLRPREILEDGAAKISVHRPVVFSHSTIRTQFYTNSINMQSLFWSWVLQAAFVIKIS